MKDDDTLYLIMSNGTYSYQHEMRVSSVIAGAPVFNTNGFVDQTIVVSMPTYMRLC